MTFLFVIFLIVTASGFIVAVAGRPTLNMIRQRGPKKVDYDNIRMLEHAIYESDLVMHFAGHQNSECRTCRDHRKMRRELSPENRAKARRDADAMHFNYELGTIEIPRPSVVPEGARVEKMYDRAALTALVWTWYDVRTGQQHAYRLPIAAKAVTMNTGFG